MFELFSGEHRRVPHRDTVPLVISTAVHVVVIGAMAAIPLLCLREADAILGPRNVVVVADVLANAGGVTAAISSRCRATPATTGRRTTSSRRWRLR
jgi:hypothetical protein